MDKPTVGLPKGFSINVPKPVELGDYLDETTQPKQRQISSQLSSQIENSNVESEKSSDRSVEPILHSIPESSSNTVAPNPHAVATLNRTRRKPRRQINMSSSTEEKLNQIIAYVQDYGPQDDAAASEIMEAIINVHFESLSCVRFGSVRPRGSWGSPTAKAFKHALSQVFTKAVIDYQEQ